MDGTHRVTTRHVALLRGINVGGNARVPMAVLRSIFEERYADVTTLLNSGNVVFSASGGEVDVPWLSQRVADETGVTAHMLVIEASRFRAIAEAMPFDGDGSRMLVTFMPFVPQGVIVPELDGEFIQIGPDATYQSLPNGILSTQLPPSFWKQFPPEQTGRNYNTVQKILARL